ncbi:MAG: Fe-S protein assembly co-chaperone HscB [Chitinophagaceae bacterium]
MKYFELFDIPIQLSVNTKTLSDKFFSLSKKYHPDFYARDSVNNQAMALEKSSQINKAWHTFQNPDATIKYVLIEKGLMEEEEKYELPPDFLMEVMDVNEQLMDADDSTTAPKILATINQLQDEIYSPVSKIVENYQDDTVSQEELLQVKEYYYKKKYLDRIRRQLKGMA